MNETLKHGIQTSVLETMKIPAVKEEKVLMVADRGSYPNSQNSQRGITE
jgi:hypothetical protein